MKLDPIALAVPLFLGLIGLEVWTMRRQGKRLYRYADAIANLSCGIGSEVARLFLGLPALLAYAWVYEHLRLVDLGPYPLAAWLLAFFGLDCLYYWFHRLSHEINVLWALHVVHHQSQDYNLSVALRQSWLQGFVATPIYFPLAVLGVSPQIFAANLAISLLYQFWIHTQTIDKLPRWYELVLNTPSHHRVHHGINPEYIDRNHAGILIIWDRLFGTFEPERATAVFGTVKPLESVNALWANLEYWRELGNLTPRIERVRDKLRLWFENPEWRPAELGGPHKAPPVDAATFSKWQTRFPRAYKQYINAHFISIGPGIALLVLFHAQLPVATQILLGGLVVTTTVIWGGLLEMKRWALPLEWTRQIVLFFAISSLAATAPWIAGTLALLIALNAAWLWRITKRPGPACES